MNFFCKNLKALRKARGISQEEMAKELGLKRSALGNYENGYSTPEYDILIQIAKYLGVTLDGFLTKDLSIDVVLKNQDDKLKIVFPKGTNYFDLEKKVDELYSWYTEIKNKI